MVNLALFLGICALFLQLIRSKFASEYQVVTESQVVLVRMTNMLALLEVNSISENLQAVLASCIQ